MTLYNEPHFFHPNDLGRYSLGTKNKGLQRSTDGSLTLYAGATSPAADKETNWLPAPAHALDRLRACACAIARKRSQQLASARLPW